MPTGILKYKQDDGSIVELTPAGFVTQTTYDAGQAAQDGRLDALENSKPSYATYADFFAGAPLTPFNCYMTNALSTDHRTCNIVLKAGAEFTTKLPAGVTIAETASTAEIILKVLYYSSEADGTFRAGYSSGAATGTVKRTNVNRELSFTLTNDVTMFGITTETAFNQPVTVIGFRG